ncbi:MAG: SNF2 helicase-associated domain-containing protein, partial [Bacteroidales bacterium]|nr:SNF2 helicase-associated domain-containing protein [Bacteroidales bacterium]
MLQNKFIKNLTQKDIIIFAFVILCLQNTFDYNIMAKYGKTYWGKQFLNALENIDYSNRLPRGRSYASNGSVKSILIEKNKIFAKVKGSRPKPYNIEITIPEFTDDQKKKLLDVIKSNPTILANLLNRQLPADLLKIATDNGIKIFPSQWKDFRMDCSCPDWAVPCKHLAAVIYIIANEIDLNPFKVLELHGLDVLAELSKQGLEIENSASEEIESWDEYFAIKPVNIGSSQIESLNELDFTIIPKYDDKFLNLLSPNPPFYDKDFKNELLTYYKFATKNINRHHFKWFGKSDNINIHNCIKASIVISKSKGDFLVDLYFENEIKRISLIELFHIFDNSEDFKITQVSDSIKLLYYYFLFSNKLIEQGAIIPQLCAFNESYHIFWHPLMQDGLIKFQLEIFNKFFSEIEIINESGKKISYFSSPEHLSTIVSSIFVSEIIADIINYGKKPNAYDGTLNLFFGKHYSIDQNNRDIFNSIQLWLNKLHIHNRSYIPVLEVQDSYPDFNVGLQIKTNTKDTIEAPVPFHLFKKKNKDKIIAVIKDLLQLQDHFPELSTIINSSDKHIISYNSEKFAEFLLQMIPVLSLLGADVLIDKSLKNIIKPAASLKIKSTTTTGVKTYMGLLSILDFEWQVAVGDELLSEEEFLRLVK